jgi:hypothetical protein
MTKHFRYFFDGGFGLVPTAKTKEIREKLIKAMSPGRPSTFYQALANGIKDIRMPLYEEITGVLVQAGVPERKIWRKVLEED